MATASADSAPSSWPRLILLLAVFCSIAGISALLAWAMVRGNDTIARRLIAIPSASLDITAAALDAQIHIAMGLETQQPSDSQPIPAPASGSPTQPEIISEHISGEVTATPVPPLQPVPTPAKSNIPWKDNAARYVRADGRAKIAIIVAGMGLREKDTQKALDQLPPLVTFGFSPYGQNLDKSIIAARAKNQEVLIELPMEPVYFPSSDPGPYGLLSANSTDDNAKRLEMVAQKTNQAVGFLALMGGKFLANDLALRPVIADIKKRGYLFVDNLSTVNSLAGKIAADAKTPFAAVTLVLDAEPSADAIKQKLKELENQASSSGYAVGLVRNYPISVDSLSAWIAGLDAKGISFVPITALIDIAH